MEDKMLLLMSAYITWGQLIILLLAILAPYYTICFLFLYRAKIKNYIQASKGVTWKRNNNPENMHGNTSPQTGRSDIFHTHVHELINDINTVIKTATRDQLSQDQILEAIQYRLADYPSIKGTDFQKAVDEHIVLELENNCNVVLSQNEISKMW